MHNTVVVFSFSPRRLRRRIGVVHYAAIVRRFPRRAWTATRRRLVEVFTLSPLVHVATGNAAYVVNVCYERVLYPPTPEYILTRPGLAWLFIVETRHEAHPADFDDRRRISTLASLLRWMTFGVTPAHNCVTTSCDMLRGAGVDVPRRITTPAGLYDWLRRSGHEQLELGRLDDR